MLTFYKIYQHSLQTFSSTYQNEEYLTSNILNGRIAAIEISPTKTMNWSTNHILEIIWTFNEHL